jgi:hypothetical protein
MTSRLQRAATVALIVLFALVGVGAPVLLVLGAQRGNAALADTEGLGVMRLSSATVDIVAGERGASITATNLAPGDRVVGPMRWPRGCAGTCGWRRARRRAPPRRTVRPGTTCGSTPSSTCRVRVS